MYLAKDIRGYSYDGAYSQGRLTLRPSVRAEWGKNHFVDVLYTRISGGSYNLMTDRSNLTLVAGMKF